jgi:hypothetical protein
MKDLITGGLVGLGIAAVMFTLDYMLIRRNAAERAKRNHQKIVTFDATDKKRIHSLLRFCAVLPFGLAFAWWMIG